MRPHQKWYWQFRINDRRHYHWNGESWFQFRPLAEEGSTRESQRPWYSMERKRRCLSPSGLLAAATLSFPEVDGDLFTVQWSEVLPIRSVPADSSIHSTDTKESEGEFSSPNYGSRFLSNMENSEYFRRLVGPFVSPSETDLLALYESLCNGELLAYSDGSFSRGSGTGSHAWVFATSKGTVLFKGAGPIDCHPEL